MKVGKDYYLHHMGVVSYRPQAGLFCGYLFFLGDPDRPRGLLIARLDQPPTATEEELITKIIKAMQAHYFGGYQKGWPKEKMPTSMTVALSLGGLLPGLRQGHGSHCETIVTHSLAQLIANPSLKRDTWSKIQKVMALLTADKA